jgi:hypothetical protein
MNLWRIPHDHPLDRLASYRALNTVHWSVGDWFETCPEMYWEQLEMLPPAYQVGTSFTCGEDRDTGVAHAYVELVGPRYFCILTRNTQEGLIEAIRALSIETRKEN